MVDGFYEWQARGKRSQPFYIRRKDHAPFFPALAWQSVRFVWLLPFVAKELGVFG